MLFVEITVAIFIRVSVISGASTKTCGGHEENKQTKQMSTVAIGYRSQNMNVGTCVRRGACVLIMQPCTQRTLIPSNIKTPYPSSVRSSLHTGSRTRFSLQHES